MYDVLVDGTAMTEIIVPATIDRLRLAPAEDISRQDGERSGGRVRRAVPVEGPPAPGLHRYEYIVIDTPPTLGLITVNAMVAATHLLIPIQSSYFALEGTDDLLETMEKIKARANPDLQLLGV